jgi:hypothetical protein
MPAVERACVLKWWLLLQTAAGCASAPPPEPPRPVTYLAKGDLCKEVAGLAGTATVVKLKAKAGEIPTPAGAPPESVVAYVISEEAAKLGWSHEETRAFAKEIWDAPAQAGFKWEILRAHLYYTTACGLATAGTPVRPYPTLTTRLQSCLASPDHNVQRACAEREIR